VESPADAADRTGTAGVGRSTASHEPKIPIALRSRAFTQADESRSHGNSALTMKSIKTGGDILAHQRVWSAPLDKIRPGCSAKFHILWRDRLVEGFVVNFDGHYYAYVNYCIHAGTPLDWWPNEFFNHDGRFLICGTHGSVYEPDTGKCAGGPCVGGTLFPLEVQVTEGRVVVTASCDPER
jgi:nitrite reductase/ring-hydroxylating ferredoxin subunit